jgi:hypothetical protein
MSLPGVAEPIVMAFSIAFTEPTFQRFLVLSAGGILTSGRRTITRVLWTMGELAEGHFTDYHRVFSRAPWSLWKLGRVLARLLVELVPDEWVVVAIDETVAGHKGKKVYGKGCHHDAVRSTHSHVAWKWGHKWVVLAIVVRFPFARRPWALPVLCALYRPEELNKAEGRRHKTPAELARGLMAALLHWFPERKFVFLGDGGYASHALASFCHRHRKRAALVSRFHGDAALYDPPPKKKTGRGRPPVKGRKRQSPEKVVAGTSLSKTKTTVVDWYGCTEREVKLVSGQGQWYRAAQGLVPVEWVFVRDVTGTRRDEYFFCTQPGLFQPKRIVSLYTQRWTIEVTFQEVREHLGFETPRQRVANSVLRMAPCLLGLFSVVSLIYHVHRHRKTTEPELGHRPGYEKAEPTFSDALSEVRRLFWMQTFFQQTYFSKAFKKIPPKMKTTLLGFLCQAV